MSNKKRIQNKQRALNGISLRKKAISFYKHYLNQEIKYKKTDNYSYDADIFKTHFHDEIVLSEGIVDWYQEFKNKSRVLK